MSNLKFTFTLSEEEARKALAKKLTYQEWIELFEINSKTYGNWDVDLKITSHFVEKVKSWFDDTLDDRVPENLLPILQESVVKDFAERNKKNENIKLEEVSNEVELKAIETLRDYKVVTYQDAINIFYEGYEFNREPKETNLSEFSTEELLQEIKNRTK